LLTPNEQTMLTTDELKAIPLFSALEVKDLEHLVRTCEDVHLRASEFAVHEGGERALFAVLAGKMEKLIDGIERRLGWRAPGTIFGEVPIALGTPFPAAYRASEPSRVMRMDVGQYYALAAASPEVAAKVGALARERMGGLQGITAGDRFIGKGCLLWGGTQRSRCHQWTRSPPHWCRKFSWPGGFVFCQLCTPSDTRCARRFPREEHVSIPD
jgi:hypothetical protein